MPPAKSIIVNTDHILANVARIAREQRLEVEAYFNQPEQERYKFLLPEQLADADWAARDLELLAGKSLTASERIRHQQAVRKLEADGLLVLDTRHVRLTQAGNAAVDKLRK